MKDEKRKDGYYWVSRLGLRKKEIALWTNGNWWLPMYRGAFNDSDFKHINENKII